MGKLRFVQPEIVRLELSDGDWIDVKKRLTVRESRHVMSQLGGEVNTETGWRKPNFELAGIAQMAAYIVRWSFRDANDLPMPVSIDSIGRMDEADFAEVDRALDKHIEAMDAEREAAKNPKDGETKPVATSPSSV